jgi:uncharacterized membrane protein
MPDGANDEPKEIRVVSIYSTWWRYNGPGAPSEILPNRLELGGLEEHYELYKDQLPRLLPYEFLGGRFGKKNDIELENSIEGTQITRADAMLFALPSNQVVLAVVFAFPAKQLRRKDHAKPVVDILEQSVRGSLRIRGDNLTKYLYTLRERISPEYRSFLTREELSDTPANVLLPERHQLVFVPRLSRYERVPSPAVVDEIVYREEAPYREEFGQQRNPEQLNRFRLAEPRGDAMRRRLRRFGQGLGADKELEKLGVVTPYVSLLYDHKRVVEHSILLSTVHAVGTASRFRQIWHDAYEQVSTFREQKQQQTTGRQTRADLEELADNLGNLEFDLTFSVEFPLMRIETFQTDLYQAMDLSHQAEALSRMFDQLGGSLRSEITAIDVRERRREETHEKWNAFTAGVLSLVGVAVGFIIAFLGINTTEVPDAKVSMWNHRFADLYLFAAGFALTPGLLIAAPYVARWAWPRTDRRALWFGLAAILLGLASFSGAVRGDHEQAGVAIAVGAFFKVLGVFLVFGGLILTILWRGRILVEQVRARRQQRRDQQCADVGSRPRPAPGTRPGARGTRPRESSGPWGTSNRSFR